MEAGTRVRYVKRVVVGMAALGFAPFSAATPAAVAAPTSVPLPFDQGEAVRIVQGYNGGTHQGASVYGAARRRSEQRQRAI